MGKQKAVEPRPKGRRNAARRYVSERGVARGLEGRAPSDTATATTAGATAGPGETLNSLQGRTGNEHRFVCSRNERTLRAPARPPPRGAPARTVYLAARFHRYRADERETEPEGGGEEEGQEEVEERLDGAASLVTRPGNVTLARLFDQPLSRAHARSR